MARRGPKDVKVEVDNSSGTLVDLSANIRSIGGIKRTSTMVDDAQGFGEAWMKTIATGVQKGEDIAIEAWYDDASDETHEVLSQAPDGPDATTKTLTITLGGGKSSSWEGYFVDYERVLDRGTNHICRATFRPTGAPTEV